MARVTLIMGVIVRVEDDRILVEEKTGSRRFIVASEGQCEFARKRLESQYRDLPLAFLCQCKTATLRYLIKITFPRYILQDSRKRLRVQKAEIETQRLQEEARSNITAGGRVRGRALSPGSSHTNVVHTKYKAPLIQAEKDDE